MPRTTSVYPRGHFFQQIAGAHQVSTDAMISDRGFFGLTLSATFLYGCLRTEDGTMYEISRRISHQQRPDLGRLLSTEEAISRPPSLLLFQSTAIDGQQLRYDLPRMQAQATSDGTVIGREGDDAVWRSADDAKGGAFRITFNEQRSSWFEDGLFTLGGPILKPGLHWYLPGRDYGTYYVSQLFQVEGTVLGQPVTGMLGFDQTYMGEGGNLYRDKDLVMENHGHIIWYTWATRYQDGSWEGGHFMAGHGPLGFAVFTDGRTVTYTRDITGRVFPRPGTPFAERLELAIDGEAWEFIPDPKGAMPDMMRKHPPTPQQEGRWQRVGETRQPAVWFAWGETEPDHGQTPADRLPTEPIVAA